MGMGCGISGVRLDRVLVMVDVEVRDPVHGFIRLTPPEERILNSPSLQRLRRIRQLALAALVYPGALHTRFDHSLGVLHLARRLSEHLLPDRKYEDERRLVRLAALLHDLGHGPFSHVSESVLIRYSKIPPDPTKGVETLHEAVTSSLIERSPDLDSLISKADKKEIIDILSKGSNRLLRSMVSGPLDADKLDYLQRDSHFCGVKYGVFDLDRLIGSMEPSSDVDPTLVIRDDGVHCLEQFVLAKYYMTTQVYRHRVRLITDQMITRALTLGVEVDGLDWLRQLYTYEDSTSHSLLWTSYDDQELSGRLVTGRGYAADMIGRLRSRQLHKRAFRADITRFSPEARLMLTEEFGRYRKSIETLVADLLGVDPLLVIAHRYTVQSQREEDQESVGSIPVRRPTGYYTFYEASPLFAALDTRYKQTYLELYVPVPPCGPTRGSDIEEAWSSRILAELETVLKPEGDLDGKPTATARDT
jgi:HD superfamily phosphohydrolase